MKQVATAEDLRKAARVAYFSLARPPNGTKRRTKSIRFMRDRKVYTKKASSTAEPWGTVAAEPARRYGSACPHGTSASSSASNVPSTRRR